MHIFACKHNWHKIKVQFKEYLQKTEVHFKSKDTRHHLSTKKEKRKEKKTLDIKIIGRLNNTLHKTEL